MQQKFYFDLLLYNWFVYILFDLFFPVCFQISLFNFACEAKISRSSHREEFPIITVPVRQGHFLRSLVSQEPATLLKIKPFINISMGTVTQIFVIPHVF